MIETTRNGARLRTPYKAARVPARDKRNSFAIHGYTGSNGGGKTMCAVFDSLPTLAAGRPIVSTCRILDPVTGDPHPLWVPLDDFRLILELDHCDVILDEVTGVASSRESAGLPAAVANHLNQLRKGDVTLRWTTPNWRRADTIIREVTQGLTTCIGLVPKPESVVSDDGLVRRWKQRRLFSWKTYDAQRFDEWSAAKERSSSKQHRLRPVARQLFWGPGDVVQDCYDTYEVALTLGVVSDRGLCTDCGGARAARKCQCEARIKKGESVTRDDSAGMLRWREVNAARRGYLPLHELAGLAPDHTALLDREELASQAGRHRGDRAYVQHVEIPETDDTPGVVVETASAS